MPVMTFVLGVELQWELRGIGSGDVRPTKRNAQILIARFRAMLFLMGFLLVWHIAVDCPVVTTARLLITQWRLQRIIYAWMLLLRRHSLIEADVACDHGQPRC